VWARKAFGGTPDVKALDQYMPEAGAGRTSGASSGS
jgi:predicted Rdx family selenoprotein